MKSCQNKSDIQLMNYYNNIFENLRSNPEGLLSEPDDRFKKWFEKRQSNKKALDLGYGYGNYSLFFHSKGYSVDAVDMINPGIFKRRLKMEDTNSLPPINIIQQNLRVYNLHEMYDAIISRNTLHYLPKSRTVSLLKQIEKSGNCDCKLYLEIFANISRKGVKGLKNGNNRDLNFYILQLVNIFRNWNYWINITDYSEKQNVYSFKAKKIRFQAIKGAKAMN